MQPGLKQKLESCKNLPSLPPVAVHVIRLCQRENFDIADVGRSIESDPGLSAKIVSLANSPLFSVKRQVANLSQVLMLLGVDSVRTLALGFSIVGELRAHERGAVTAAFWKRALIAATIAQDLGRMEGMRHPEEAFLAALLQDVGQLAIEQFAFDTYLPICRAAGTDHARLREQEMAAFGCDHAEIGRWLLTQWRLPESIRVAVGSSHEPLRRQRGANPATEKTTAIVAVSGVMADIWVAKDTAEAARVAGVKLREMLGLDTDRIVGLIKRVNAAIVTIAPLFGLQLGDADELGALGEWAEYALRHPDEVIARAARGAALSVNGVATSPPAIDELTGLATRGRFDEYLREQFEFAQQVGKPLSLILCDPDHLDMLNQTFGTDAGDKALHEIANLVGERLRYRDLAARYGGEEFVLLLTDTRAAGATVVAERLRKKVEENLLDVGIGDPVRMTVSLACVTLDGPLTFQSPGDLLSALEQALAEAKRSGRNRVISFAQLTVAA
jgi:diguanylate cyclase (GGDEF)-like protein